ncbi:hypothetical protein ACJMK2_043163, partial [Sinanodonta woodiana]
MTAMLDIETKAFGRCITFGLLLFLLMLQTVQTKRNRDKTRHDQYQADDSTNVNDLKGPNVCGSAFRKTCCRGWSSPTGVSRCIVPICIGGCGGGTCMRPGLCLCPTGQISPTCDSNVDLCGGGCQNGGRCIALNLCRCKQGFGGTRCETDQRTGPCFTQLAENTCRGALPGVVCTKNLCCATIGMAWGNPCEQCPAEPHPCRRGYIPHLQKNTCQDIDECKAIQGLCVGGNCINTVGSYTCECKEGSRQNPITKVCEDINECEDRDICGAGVCTNTEGSYFCTCNPGYELTADRKKCIAIRKKFCYTRIRNNVCSDEISAKTSFQDCCCGVGKGWGDSDLCQLCPELNTDAYARLCTSPQPIERNECSYFSNLCKNGRCVDTPYSYRCDCYDGYRLADTGTECQDIDECTTQTGICLNGKCMNTPGSFECMCNEGFVLASSKRYCTDMNECESNKMCPNGQCINMDGTYKCQCNKGYKQSPNQQVCTDIDECRENGKICLNGQCLNLDGSYRCICNPGYRLSPDGAFCLDYNECQSGMCSNGRCVNMDGSFRCICNLGYVLAPNGEICIDIDECETQPGICVNGQCINSQGSYRCECPHGFTLGPDRKTCLDTRRDLCYMDYRNGVCGSPSRVLVTKSTCCCTVDSMEAVGIAWGRDCEPCPSMSDTQYKVLCPHGPDRDHNGKDINQCVVMPNICEHGSCENLDPGYRCICDPGFESDRTGKRCLDVNECVVNPRLCDGGQCRNTPGSFTCSCPAGFKLEPSQHLCEDINECQSGPCIGGECVNIGGSFRCECRIPGMTLDSSGRICTDNRRGLCWLTIKNGQCEDNIRQPMLKSECCGTIGKAWGSPCEPCPSPAELRCQPGFQFEGGECKDINECLLFPNICEGGGHCKNTQGSFTCSCPEGLSLDSTGRRCMDRRKANCYLEYEQGQCSSPIGGLHSRTTCCCTLGKAWGPSCTSCPSKESEEYNVLCSRDPVTMQPIDINECTEFPGICQNGQCRNTPTGFTCVCNQGYATDDKGYTCTDIDECRISFGICTNGKCVNTQGAFRCECEPGFRGVMMDQMCMDIDECTEMLAMCRGGTCANTPGSYTCRCPEGLELTPDGRRCVDVDECSAISSVCSNGYCENFMGGYQCICQQGYQQNAQHTTCVDIEECGENNGGCMMLCINTAGSFTCACNMGFNLNQDGKTCTDINECKENPDICNGGKCVDLPGGYRCTCVGGLVPSEDQKQCIDVDECAISRDLCDRGECQNTHGSYVCRCDVGYTVKDMTRNPRCTDIDECESQEARCDENAACINTQGSYKCDCKPGYSGDGFTCRDLNECLRNNGGCSSDATCINLPGSSRCVCDEGFTGDGYECRDVDECTLNPDTCDNGQCFNFPGSYRCQCEMGFAPTDDEKKCFDINECELFPNLCVNGKCENMFGMFRCKCNQGFIVDSSGGNCTDIDECDNPENCQYGTCVNTPGAFLCQCPPGYELNPTGTGCIDLRKGMCYMNVSRQPSTRMCSDVIAQSVSQASCCCSIGKGWGEIRGFCDLCPVENTSEYRSLCRGGPGFRPNPKTLLLEDIDECAEIPNLCKDGTCQNTFGSYICTCHDGYKLRPNGVDCVDIDECKEQPYVCGLGTCANLPGNFTCLCPDGYMPMPGEGCMDMRKDVCYASYRNISQRPFIACEHPLSTQVTKRQCCCQDSVGAAWGTTCIPCPRKRTTEYEELCKPIPELKEPTNECTLFQLLCENGRCVDLEEGYRCDCFPGYLYNSVSKKCEDEDECQRRRSPCQGNAICINTEGSFRCECVTGYRLSQDGRRCEDIDECNEISGICSNGDCENLNGAFRCICKNGFRLASTRDACLDVNECELQPHLCRNGTCENRIGTYKCHCDPGFQLSENEDCIDIDECRALLAPCLNGRCQNVPGSFVCQCQPGYSLTTDRLNCRDMDECAEIPGICRRGRCENTEGSYVCSCFDGYQLSRTGEECQDVNECRTVQGICANGQCINTDGSFRCSCPPDYVVSSDGKTCVDIRQGSCFRAFDRGVCRDPRPMNMTRAQCCCTGGEAWQYSRIVLCEVCPKPGEAGYADLCKRDGTTIEPSGTAIDLNECLFNPDLCKNGRCINTDGSFRCECDPGYVVDSTGSTCIDNDECQVRSMCGNGTCSNTVGSFHCTCGPGFAPGPKEVCEDENECDGPLNQCVFRCVNIPGSFKCICPMGYKVAANGIHCEDVDECETPANTCKFACKNLVGSFMCICPEGYREIGRDRCEDINECSDPNICKNGRCVNLQGSHRCDCAPGYTPSVSGKACLDTREDYCFFELSGGRCIRTITTILSTRVACCCAGGAAWGRGCEHCPQSGSAQYKDLCPAGPGYNPDGSDIDECRTMPGACANGRCLNTMGSYRCVCNTGYKTDTTGKSCIDVNECEPGLSQCEKLCHNTEGSYRCACERGYTLNMDGKTCRDLDECTLMQHNCPHECVNTVGSFRCGCPRGYKEIRGQCSDIDECTEQPQLCSPGGVCHNTLGSFNCVCKRGFKLDSTGTKCIDLDECENGVCDKLACENGVGTFYCGCPDGFTETHGQCVEIDICFGNPCLFGCIPSGQDFMCGCPPGYQMMGQGHCVQTIAPDDYTSMYPPGVKLPHEEGTGDKTLPPGEGCYSCNIGQDKLELPLSRRNKRSAEGKEYREINMEAEVKGKEKVGNEKDLTDLQEEVVDLHTFDSLFMRAKDSEGSIEKEPYSVSLVKRDAKRRKHHNRHKPRPVLHGNTTVVLYPETVELAKSLSIYVNHTNIKRKTKLMSMLPALKALKDNVEYDILKGNKQFFIKEK